MQPQSVFFSFLYATFVSRTPSSTTITTEQTDRKKAWGLVRGLPPTNYPGTPLHISILLRALASGSKRHSIQHLTSATTTTTLATATTTSFPWLPAPGVASIYHPHWLASGSFSTTSLSHHLCWPPIPHFYQLRSTTGITANLHHQWPTSGSATTITIGRPPGQPPTSLPLVACCKYSCHSSPPLVIPWVDHQHPNCPAFRLATSTSIGQPPGWPPPPQVVSLQVGHPYLKSTSCTQPQVLLLFPTTNSWPLSRLPRQVLGF